MGHNPLYFLSDTGEFPNSHLPVVLLRQAIPLPVFFKARHIRRIFENNGWSNAWDSGVFTYHHYHSTSHEVLGFYKGKTTILLGGPDGKKVKVKAGDVLIIPAGVAHKNLGLQNQVHCIGAYPDARHFDICTGTAGERPATDRNIAALPIPEKDPVTGTNRGVVQIWTAVLSRGEDPNV